MIKKISVVGLCSLSLMGLVGCSSGQEMEQELLSNQTDMEEVYLEDDQTNYLWYQGWGVAPHTLFEALNEVNPALNLDESLFEVWVDEESGEKTFIGSPIEKVVIDYQIIQTDASYTIEDESLVGTIANGLYIAYDKTNEEASKYANELLNAFQTVWIQELLPHTFQSDIGEFVSQVEVRLEAFEPGTMHGYPVEEIESPYQSYLEDFEQIATISIL